MPATTRTDEAIAYGPNDIPRVAPLSRTAVFEALRTGRLRSYKVGRRTIVMRADLEAFIRSDGGTPSRQADDIERAVEL